MIKQKIILIGGGGHCHSVIDVLELVDAYEIMGVIDIAENIGKTVLNYPIIGSDYDLKDIHSSCDNALITIGQIKTNTLRRKIFNLCKEIGFNFPSIISPLAHVSKHAQIGEGTIVMHHALVNANAKIGKNCIINTKALIEHDVIVGDHCHLSTACVINGNTLIEDDTFFGSNAVSKQGIKVGGFIRAGSLQK